MIPLFQFNQHIQAPYNYDKTAGVPLKLNSGIEESRLKRNIN